MPKADFQLPDSCKRTPERSQAYQILKDLVIRSNGVVDGLVKVFHAVKPLMTVPIQPVVAEPDYVPDPAKYVFNDALGVFMAKGFEDFAPAWLEEYPDGSVALGDFNHSIMMLLPQLEPRFQVFFWERLYLQLMEHNGVLGDVFLRARLHVEQRIRQHSIEEWHDYAARVTKWHNIMYTAAFGSVEEFQDPTKEKELIDAAQRAMRARKRAKQMIAQLVRMKCDPPVLKNCFDAFELPLWVGSNDHKAVSVAQALRIGCARKPSRLRWWDLKAKWLEELDQRIEQAYESKAAVRAERKARRQETTALRKQRAELAAMTQAEVEAVETLVDLADGPVLQSGLEPTGSSRRLARDEARRVARKEYLEAKRKEEPKAERKQRVKQQRDKRSTVCADDVEIQSGLDKAVLVAASAVVLGQVVRVTKMLAGAVKGVARTADSIGNTIAPLLQSIKSFVDDLKVKLGSTLWCVPFSLLLWYANRVFGDTVYSRAIFLALGVKVMGSKLMEALGPFFAKGDDDVGPVLQGGVDDTLSMAPKLLATAFSFSVLGANRKNATDEFCKRISNVDRMSNGFESLMTWGLSAFQKLVNMVRSMMGKDPVVLARTGERMLAEWCREVDSLQVEEMLGETCDPRTIGVMQKLVQRGVEMRDTYGHLSGPGKVVTKYLGILNERMSPYFGALNASNNFRFEPSMLTFVSEPGQGKSVLSMTICTALMLESGILPAGTTPADVKLNVWSKGVSEFWNGYAQQACIVMDDVFQAKAVNNGMENDYMNIIKMVNSFAAPLNFADLASKGKVYFNSKFIYASTNLPCIRSEAGVLVNDLDAVLRRMDFSYKLRVVEGFKLDGKLDYAKFKSEMAKLTHERGMDRFPWHIWEVAEHNFGTGVTVPSWQPLRVVLDKVAATLRRKLSNFKASERELDSFIDSFPRLQSGLEVGSEDELNLGMFFDTPDSTVRLFDGVSSRVLTAVPRYSSLPVDSCGSSAVGSECGDVHLLNPLGSSLDTAGLLSLQGKMREQRRHAGRRVLSTPGFFRNLFDAWVHEYRSMEHAFEKVLWVVGSVVWTLMLFDIVKILLRSIWAIVRSFFRREGLSKPGVVADCVDAVDGEVPTVRTQSNIAHSQWRELKGPQLQTGIDSGIVSGFSSNSYKIVLQGEKVRYVGQCLFLMSRLCVQPRHFTLTLKDRVDRGVTKLDDRLSFVNVYNNKFSRDMSVDCYLKLLRHSSGQDDIEFLVLPEMRAHRNIVGNFIRETDVPSVLGYQSRLDVIQPSGRRDGSLERVVFSSAISNLLPKVNAKGYELGRCWQFFAPTEEGDCGAVLSALNADSFQGRVLLGLHVAADAHSRGFAIVLTQERIKEAIKKLGVVEDAFLSDISLRTGLGYELHDEHVAPAEQRFDCKGSFLPILTMEKKVNICCETSYFKTEHYGCFGPSGQMPAAMHPKNIDGVLVYPMENALAPYRSDVLQYEQPWLKQAVHVAMRKFSQETQHLPRDLFTFDQAILGIPERKFRSIPRATAAGFPYVYDVKNGKKEFFGWAEEYSLDGDKCAELRQRVEYVEACAKRGVRLAHVFLDFMKDELRSAEKVENLMTRLISSSPLDYTVLWRMYFGAFMSAMMRSHTESGMAPGINPFNDWGRLATLLRSKGTDVFDGDFKAFDSSEQPTLLVHILDFVNDWYADGPVNARVRTVLWEDLVHSRHIGGLGFDQRFVYQWNKSLPSGHPFTTVVNSIYSLTLLVAAYFVSTKDMFGFWSNVYAVTYGDDNVSNVRTDLRAYYNQRVVSEILRQEFGVTYTPGDKSGVFKDVMSLEDVTFLKRRFVLEDGIWYCPLELESFLYTVYWCKNKKEKKKIERDVLENALLELSMHTQETWDRYAPMVAERFKIIGHISMCPIKKPDYEFAMRSRVDAYF